MSLSPHIHIALMDAHEAEIVRRMKQSRPAIAAPRQRPVEEQPRDSRVHRGLVRLHLAPARQPSPSS
jgi:hypothetical protein